MSDVEDDEADPDRYRQITLERESRDAAERYDNGAPEEGMRDVLYGELELYPESNYPYKLRHYGRDIPIEMKNGRRYLGHSVKMTVKYTGDGRKFDIETLEILE